MKDKVSRRGFLKSAAMAAGLAASVPVLEACAQVAPTPVIVEKKVVETVIVEKPVEVEKKVVQTVIVEKPVEKKVVETVVVEKPVEKKVVETVVVEKPVQVTPTPQYKDALIRIANWMAPDSPEHWVTQLVNERFKKEFPGTLVEITIHASSAAGSPYQKDILKMKTGEAPPTVMHSVTLDLGQSFLQAAVKENWLYSLNKELDEPSYDTPGKTWKETIAPGMLAPGLTFLQWEGNWIAVPRELSGMTMMYNKGVTDKLGIQEPKTWPEFLAALDVLKKNNIIPISSSPGYAPHWLIMLIHRVVGSAVGADVLFGRKSALEEPGILEAAKLFEQLRDNYFAEGWEGSTAQWPLMVQGKAGFTYDGYWMVPGEAKDMPEGFDLGISYVPEVPGGKGPRKSYQGWANVFSVMGRAKYPELGAQWLKIYCSVEFQTMRVRQQGIVPSYLGVPTAEFPPRKKLAEVFMGADEVINLNLGVQFPLPALMTKINDTIQKFMLKQETAEEWVKDLDETIKKFLAEQEKA